jgi:hypothetical protein
MADFKPQTQTSTTISGISLTKFNSTGSASMLDSVVTTIHTQVYVTGSFENLTLVTASGSTNAVYTLFKNTVKFDTRRSLPGRNVTFDFTGAPLELSVGDVIDVKAEHFNSGVVESFDATIYGYDA